MFSSLEFYSQPVKYESKIFKFSECTVSTFFPFTCSSSGIYVLPKQIKLREEGIEPREKRNSMQKIERKSQDHGERRLQTRAKLQPCRYGKSKAHDFCF